MKVQNNQNNAFPPPIPTVASLIPSHLKPTNQTNQPNQPTVQTFVRPEINNQAFKATMDNYRERKAVYKKEVNQTNQATAKYNKKVEDFANNDKKLESKLKVISGFVESFNHFKPEPYNEAVENFNSLHGLYFKKRKIQPLKPLSEQVFAAILHAYSVQLRHSVNLREKMGETFKRTNPKVSINPSEIINQKRNGHQNLDISTRTLRNHRDRLFAAGILIEKVFRGTEKPVDYTLHPDILVIFEAFNLKIQNAKNQLLNVRKGKNVPHIKVSTRPLSNNIKIKEIVDKSKSHNMENSSNLPVIDFYKNTISQDEKEKSPAAEISLENSHENYQETKTIVSPVQEYWPLSLKLANGYYDLYKWIPIETFIEAAKQDDITNDLFREAAVQEFIRCSGIINSKSHAFPESWREAINHINKEFGCKNMVGVVKSKQDVLEKLIEFRFRIKQSIKLFTDPKKNWRNARYASDFFNPAFSHSGYVGFKFTEKFWQNKVQKTQKTAEKVLADQRLGRIATKAQQKIYADDRRLTTAITKHLNSKYTWDQLTQYVAQELPTKQQNKFPARLEKLTIKHNLKQ